MDVEVGDTILGREPPENLDLGSFADYIDQLFGDINFEPRAKTAAQNIDLLPGDHVAVEFAASDNLKIWHHGIFVGKKFNGKLHEDKMVVDNSKNKKELSLTPMVDFGGSNLVYRIDYDDDGETCRQRHRRALVKAKWALKNPHRFKYQPIGKNCEHFAMWCSTFASRQVNLDLLPHYKPVYLEDKRRSLFFADEACDLTR
jgi:hypothetical protein